MAEPTTYSRMTLKMVVPFSKYGEAEHNWSVKFALSGAALTSESDAEATALDLWTPIANLTVSDVNLVGWLYYPPGTDVNEYQATYDLGVHSGTLAGYSTGDPFHAQQAEVTALARCQVGVNSKGRAKYLFKNIHGIVCLADGQTIPDLTGTPLLKWNTGSGPHSVVPVDPTTGVAGTGWSLHTAAYTRQLRRGKKKS